VDLVFEMFQPRTRSWRQWLVWVWVGCESTKLLADKASKRGESDYCNDGDQSSGGGNSKRGHKDTVKLPDLPVDGTTEQHTILLASL